MLVGTALMYRPRRDRRLHAVALAMALGLLCHRAAALEGVDRPEVWVDAFRLEPMANYITSTGRAEVHPKGLLGLGFDSNVYATPSDEVADGYLRALAGIEGRLYPGIFDLVVYDLEVESKLWFQEDDRNMLGGRFEGEWVREGIESLASTTVHWARIDDPLIETGERIQRSEYAGGFDYGRQGYFGQWIVEADLLREAYHEDGRTFTAEQRSSWSARLGGGYTRLFSITGEVRGEGYLGARTYDDPGRFNDSWLMGALAVWKGRMGDKTVLTARGGLEGRFYEDDFLGDASYGDQIVVRPVGRVDLRWQYRPFSRVDMQVYSTMRDGSTANAVWVYGFLGEWLHAYDEQLRYGGRFDYYQVRNSGAADGADLDVRSVLRVSAIGEYEMVRGIGGRARLSYTTSDAVVSNDFDRLEIMIEAAIAF